MPDHDEIAKNARGCYDENRLAEAALLYREAAVAARKSGDHSAWYQNTVWAAEAFLRYGKDGEALSLLLSARKEETGDPPSYEAWLLRKNHYSLVANQRPSLRECTQLLADLRSYASTHPVPKGDILCLDGDLHGQCGRWAAALDSYEAAWRDYDESGYLRVGIAADAARCCLWLGQLERCRDWLKALRQDRSTQAGRGYAVEIALDLALAGHRPYTEIARRHSELLEVHTRFQADWASDAIAYANVRVWLLDATLGDPAATHHASLQELVRRPIQRSPESRFSHAVLVLDYRLACLRWGTGLPPSEDEWTIKDPPVPKRLIPRDSLTWHVRLHKARTALKLASHRAEVLDAAFECNWRYAEVTRRERRIEQIAKAATASPKGTRSGSAGRRSVPKRKADKCADAGNRTD